MKLFCPILEHLLLACRLQKQKEGLSEISQRVLQLTQNKLLNSPCSHECERTLGNCLYSNTLGDSNGFCLRRWISSDVRDYFVASQNVTARNETLSPAQRENAIAKQGKQVES